jgi:hypothetical protein
VRASAFWDWSGVRHTHGGRKAAPPPFLSSTQGIA